MIWILIVGILIAYGFIYLIFTKSWNKGLTVEVNFEDNYVYEGEESHLREVITNKKWVPLNALEVRMSLSRNLAFVGEAEDNATVSDNSYRRDVFSFLYQQRVTRRLAFVAKKRGFYSIEKMDLSAFDHFFHKCGYEMRPVNTSMYVYPAQIDTRRIKFLSTTLSGMLVQRNRLFPDPFEFAGIRDYNDKDPMSTINWKASARQGKWMVNQYDSTTNTEPVILFDIEDTHIWKQEELVEETIRIVASLSARLLDSRMPLHIYSNAGVNMDIAAGASSMGTVNKQLAVIEECKMPCQEFLGEIQEKLSATDKMERMSRIYIFVSKNTDEEIKRKIGEIASMETPLLWVRPRTFREEVAELQIPYVRMMDWEVEV